MRILRVILSVQPEHEEARALLTEIEDRVSIRHAEPEGPAADPVTSATAGDLSGRFRDALASSESRAPVERLSRWLGRVRRNRGERDV
jgi:hypothetical protein